MVEEEDEEDEDEAEEEPGEDPPKYWVCEKTAIGLDSTAISPSGPRSSEAHLREKRRQNWEPAFCCEVMRSLIFLNVAVYTPSCHPLCVEHARKHSTTR
jgi:hypothetical protein